MRKIITKIIVAMLIICFASMTAFGCGGGTPSTPSNPSTPSDPSTPPSTSSVEIAFDVNGAEETIQSMWVNTGDRITLPTPVKSGYYFLGWYNGAFKQENTGYWLYQQKVTLLAQWEKLYQVNDGVIESTTIYANQNVSHFVVPSSMDGEDIYAIAPAAFLNATQLSSVFVSSGITEIMDEAFNETTKLKSIEFESNSQLDIIGDKAFSGCTGLTSIVIPSSVTTIGANAFDGCTNLKSVTFKKTSSVEEIGENAFKGCTALSSILVPESVTSVGAGAFSGCSTQIKLEAKSLPSGFKSTWNANCSYYVGLTLKNKIQAETQLAAVNLHEAINVDLTKYGLSSVTVCYIERNNKLVSNKMYALEGDNLIIQVANLDTGVYDFSIVVNDDGKFYEIIVDYAKVLDFKISTITQYSEFLRAIQQTLYGERSFYAALTADIDGGIYENGKLISYTNVDTRYETKGGRFTGELDGQGHTISNLKVSKNAMFWQMVDVTMKNIAINNIFGSNAPSDNSLLAWGASNVYLENVYIKGIIEQRNADDIAGLSNSAGGYTMKNCIIDIEFPTNVVEDFGIIGKVGNINASSSNVYGISKSAKGLVLGQTPAGTNVAMYKTNEEFKANISASSLSSFDSKYWDTSSGIPVWKTLPTK